MDRLQLATGTGDFRVKELSSKVFKLTSYMKLAMMGEIEVTGCHTLCTGQSSVQGDNMVEDLWSWWRSNWSTLASRPGSGGSMGQ
jgi:hypothetical protein